MSPLSTIRYLGESDVQQLITLSEALDICRAAIQADAAGQVVGDKFYLPIGQRNFIKPFAGYLQGEDLAFVKTFSFSPPGDEGEISRGTSSVVLLFDVNDGQPVCLMEADWITGLRTAAASAITAESLASSGASRITIFGAGLQGEMHARAFCHEFDVDELHLLDRSLPKAQAVAERLSDEMQVTVRALPLAERQASVRSADIIVTVTTGSEPQVSFPWLKAGAFIARLGSFEEIGLDVIQGSDKLVVDRWEYVRTRIPELRKLLEAGEIGPERVYAEWPEIAGGRKPGRENPHEIILYIALGLWGEYAALLPHLYRRAMREGVGTMIERGMLL